MNKEVMLLYSCSDDGLINVYNMDNIGKTNEEIEKQENLVKTRRTQPKVGNNPVFLFSLNSIEFTGLKKNKKIDSIDISAKRGLIIGGCYGGELLIWRNDNYRREKVVKDGYELVHKIKAHSQTMHMISISVDETYFMTGSVDGTAKIWQQVAPPEYVTQVKSLDATSEMAISQCDSLEWSCRGRYAIVAFGGKENDEVISEKSIIYVWDQRSQSVIHRFGGKDSEINLENFTFVLECHPKDENFFMSGGGAGKVILWDISQGKSLNSFSETGIYNRDPNMLNEVFDGKFSSCGKFFVVATICGTFTIYSIYNPEPYFATPVEQFFQYDKLPEATSSIYNEQDVQLCNYDRMKYPEQPPWPILGERYMGRFIDPIDYEQEYEDRYSKFGKDQLFFENYVEEFGAYAFLNNRVNDEESSRRNAREDSDFSMSEGNNRERRAVYRDPNHDQFDRESDEDFVVESPNRQGTRRTIRRQPYNTDVVMREERKENQRNDRTRRYLNRNRHEQEGESASDNDADDFVIDDVVEQEDSEASQESFIKDTSSRRKSSTVRNHNFYSSHVHREPSENDEEEDSYLDKKTPVKDQVVHKSGIFENSKIVFEEEKGLDNCLIPFSSILSTYSPEDYRAERTLHEDGYHIDLKEAKSLRENDKAFYDCALCNKKKGEATIIGPFKYYVQDKVTDEMVYWFHRECLERNNIVKKINKYEFENIQQCINEWVLNVGNECAR